MYFAPTFPLFIDRDPTWKLTKSWELTHMLTNISRISKNLTHSLRIARAYSDIDFAHSRTSQGLLIAPRLVRHSAWRSSLKTTKRLGLDRTKTGLGPEIPRTGKDRNRGPVFGPSPTRNFKDRQRPVLTGLWSLKGVGYIHNSICILTNQSWFGLCINSTITTTTPPPPFNPSPSLPHVQMWDGGPPPCFPL